MAAVVGYLVGSIPTADWVGRAAGFDLRRTGTANPGTANAIGLGGLRLGAPILALDFAKGVGAVLAGLGLAGAGGAAVAGAAAVLGQVVNPWYGFRGGKGLGVTGGAVLAVFPAGFAVMLAVTAALARVVRPMARAVLVAAVFMVALAAATARAGAPWDLGPVGGGYRLGHLVAVTLIIAPKFAADVAEARRAAN